MLYAVGDGNHSLATAKSPWTEIQKAGGSPDSPAKWELVELGRAHAAFSKFKRDFRGDARVQTPFERA